ncbi:hypothetical protein VB735_18470 [Halotia wernerae UHCC 0503]|nr:hypothetical protein [Halotia wernerae UHCC 0503]
MNNYQRTPTFVSNNNDRDRLLNLWLHRQSILSEFENQYFDNQSPHHFYLDILP